MTDLKRICAAGCLALVLILSGFRLLFPLSAAAYDDRIPALSDEILQTVSEGNIDIFVSEMLPFRKAMSSSDWYAIILAVRGGYDLSEYSTALLDYLSENNVTNATTRERIALALTACEPEPPAVCTELLDQSAGELGIMSWIFALHLLNNGVPSDHFTAEEILAEMISEQAPDGGWSLNGLNGDPDVTAMTLQALAPYQNDVPDAIENGLRYLSDVQCASGAYMSFGQENPESTAQVWAALSALGMDALTDERFIANGNTLLDGILQFRTADGAYAHSLGGQPNPMAAVQVFLALNAAQMQQEGRNLFCFRGQPPALELPAQTETTAPQTDAAQPADNTEITAESIAVTTSGTAAETEQSAAASSGSTVCSTGSAVSVSAASALTESEIIHTTKPPAEPRGDTQKYPYRIPLTAAACVIFGGAAVVFLCRKNRSAKTYLTLAGGFLLTVLLIWCIKIESPEQFYQGEAKTGGGTVIMAIRCDVILGMDGSERFPADGVIMPLTEFSLAENETALELLYDAVKAYGLQIEVDGVSGELTDTAYVRGIASLYEFDFGDLSGWTYEVNGVRPSIGCGACTLHDGDRIEWRYTVNL